MNNHSLFNTTETEINTKCIISSQLNIDQVWVQALFISLYMVIFVVGVAGNLVVMGVILGNKHMWTTINLYLLNLSVSDIIMSVFASSKYLGRWSFLGEGMCKLTTTSMTVSINMSTFTLAAIAINRFLAVFYPFSTRTNSIAKTIAIIFCIDLVALIITLPFALGMEFFPSKSDEMLICRSTFSGMRYQVYVSFIHIAEFVSIPIIVICYVSIMVRLRQRAQNQPESRTETQMQEEDVRTARVNKMLMVVMLIFGICWFPEKVMFLWVTVVDIIREDACSQLILFNMYITHIIACSSACYNPFLYGWMNPAFKAEFANLCSCVTITKEKQDFEIPTKSANTEELPVDIMKDVSR